jgi:hypothetical protein
MEIRVRPQYQLANEFIPNPSVLGTGLRVGVIMRVLWVPQLTQTTHLSLLTKVTRIVQGLQVPEAAMMGTHRLETIAGMGCMGWNGVKAANSRTGRK